MSTTRDEPPEEKERRLDEAIAEYRHAVESGAQPDRAQAEILSRYPDLVQGLKEYFDNDDRFRRAVKPLCSALPPPVTSLAGRTLGDYELLEEIAHGGMGVDADRESHCRV